MQKDCKVEKRLLIIGAIWPEPTATAAGTRMLQLINLFKQDKYKITFASVAATSNLSVDFDVLGITTITIALNSSSFDVFVEELNPEVVLFDRFIIEEQFGWRVALNCPNALRILDTEDLHSLRYSRHKALKKGVPFSNISWLKEEKTLREIASIYRSDLSLIISSKEIELLVETASVPQELLSYIPFIVSKEDIENKSTLSFNKRKHFVCIGNGKHAPNVDGFHWLYNAIWPLIREKLPNAEMHIYGAHLPTSILQLHQPDKGFFIKGWAENVTDLMQNARVNLAPLRFGAGLKGKLLEGLKAKTPSITTNIGAEAMHANLDWAGEVCNSEVEFATAAVLLYSDENKWNIAQKRCTPILKLFLEEHITLNFKENLADYIQNKDLYRTKNIVGAMLQHSSMAATKYMAQWIAAKNA